MYSHKRQVEGLSRLLSKEDLIKADYSLSPTRFISSGAEEDVASIEALIPQLRNLDEERQKNVAILNDILKQLGYEDI